MAEGGADLLFLLAATVVLAVVVAGCMKARPAAAGNKKHRWVLIDRSIGWDRSID